MAEDKRKDSLAGTKITAVPVETPEIGIDTTDSFVSNIVNQAINSNIDISKLEGFSTVAQTREQIYRMIDTMAQDPILASYLKTVSEDAVEPNDAGNIVWVESDDANCAKYVTFLLDSLNVDKSAYSWMHSLAKYGDLYLRLYRQSDYDNDDIFEEEDINTRALLTESYTKEDDSFGRLSQEEIDAIEDKALKESVNVVLREKGDKYKHYVEAMPNPAEMFELTKFGKTMGYIHAPTSVHNAKQDFVNYSYMQYRMNKRDVNVYSATDFVHASLEDTSNRTPEEVDIFIDTGDDTKDSKTHTYKVKRGQSELASVFKIWRELSLLENSALLNRITKSSVVRVVGVEVGDMPKEQVASHLQALKNLMEQKAALSTGNSMQEYTNPGPIENIIYTPTHGGIGAITTDTVGGDFDPKALTDLSYFQDKLFGALGIPKAFFGITDDGAGFNGGTSLAIQSSRYGKSVKRIQNVLIQAITDLINLLLIDKGLIRYLNKFTIRMQAPVTQEELDRRENKRNKVSVIGDIMGQLSDVENPVIKLKILKALLTDSVADVEVIALLQEQIEELEERIENEGVTDEGGELEGERDAEFIPSSGPDTSFGSDEGRDSGDNFEDTMDDDLGGPESGEEEVMLPSPEDLGVDMTINQ